MMRIYIDYFISTTNTMNDKLNKTELPYRDGETIFNAADHGSSTISSEKIKELTGLVIAPNLFIIQTSWSTYDEQMSCCVVRVYG
jgi:hypothetical protein